MENIKFKLCPFCGNKNIFVGTEAEILKYDDAWSKTHYTAICDATNGGCGASIGGDCETYEEAVDCWNTRAGFEFDSPAIGYEERYANDYKQRMAIEYNELKIRYNKLHKMLVKYDAKTLDFELNCPAYLLREQKTAMSKYLNALEIRAEIENVNLEKEY